jgi:TorA maturation chaperone TorD
MNQFEYEVYARYFKLAADLLLQEPNEELLEGCGAVGSELMTLLPDVDFPRYLAQVAGEPLSQIKQEYFDLFFVPMSGCYLPPFAENWRTGLQQSDIQRNLKEIYLQAGFDCEALPLPSYLQLLDRPDHLGVQLAFMAGLFESCQQQDATDRSFLSDTVLLFYRHHLEQWVPAYSVLLKERASTALYRGLGALLDYLLQNFKEARSEWPVFTRGASSQHVPAAEL